MWRIRCGYWWVLFALVILALAVACCFAVFAKCEMTVRRWEVLTQLATATAAFVAAFFALAIADLKPRRIKAEVELSAEPHTSRTSNSTNPGTGTAQAASEGAETHQVHFCIKNVSGFTWKKPVLTFRLPLDRRYRHPESGGVTFTSNLFNSKEELRLLQVVDTLVASNGNLPFWNDQERLTIWFRMAFDSHTAPFIVSVSVNSENAEGISVPLSVDPRKLLRPDAVE